MGGGGRINFLHLKRGEAYKREGGLIEDQYGNCPRGRLLDGGRKASIREECLIQRGRLVDKSLIRKLTRSIPLPTPPILPLPCSY